MISVIIPVYNVEKYLKTCLDSVVNQTYEDKEVILINDGSTDSSGLICDEYASRFNFIKVIHKKNAGPSVARNIGISEAKGKWIIFMDADDLWADKNCLDKLHTYAEKLNLDIVRFEYQAVNEILNPIEPRTYNKDMLCNHVLDNYSTVKYAIGGEWFTVLFLILKEIISEIHFNEKMNFLEDCDFYSRLFASRPLRCGYMNEKMYLYRKLTHSLSRNLDVAKLKASFNLCDGFYISSLKTEDQRLQELYQYNSVMMYFWTLQTLASDPYYAKRATIINELHLNELHKRVINRMTNVKIKLKNQIYIKPLPYIGIRIFHVKNKIRALLS